MGSEMCIRDRFPEPQSMISPDGWTSPASPGADREQDFGVDPEYFEQRSESRLRRQAGSPSLRQTSMEMHRASPRSSEERR